VSRKPLSVAEKVLRVTKRTFRAVRKAFLMIEKVFSMTQKTFREIRKPFLEAGKVLSIAEKVFRMIKKRLSEARKDLLIAKKVFRKEKKVFRITEKVCWKAGRVSGACRNPRLTGDHRSPVANAVVAETTSIQRPIIAKSLSRSKVTSASNRQCYKLPRMGIAYVQGSIALTCLRAKRKMVASLGREFS
jgi:hypothetical protein